LSSFDLSAPIQDDESAVSHGEASSAVRAYETAALGNAILLIRGGTALVILLHLLYLVADLHHGFVAIAFDALCILLGLTGFSLTHTDWFTRWWRLLPFALATLEIALTAASATYSGDITRVLTTIILYSSGTACLVPWSPGWQQSLNLFCVVVVLLESRTLNLPEPKQLDLWIPAVVLVGIGQFATSFGERHRHLLRESAVALDQSNSRLQSQIAEREQLIGRLAQTQEELRRSERVFELFMRRMPGPAFIRDSTGKYIYVNDKMIDRFSTTRLLGKGYEQVRGLTDEQLKIIRDLDRQILETGEAVQVMETTDQPSLRHWLVHKFPIPDEEGKIEMIGGLSLDVTARVQTEAALRESEQRFRLMVEEVRDYAIILLNPEKRVISWNIGAERLYGYKPAEIVGQPSLIFLPHQERQDGTQDRGYDIALNEGRFEEEVEQARRDGTRFVANIVTTALRDDSGNLIGFVKIVRDITEQRKAEEERLRLIREQETRMLAEKALAARDEFLAVLSHELRNPIGAISNALTLIRLRMGENSGAQRAVDIAMRQTNKIARLVNDLLDLSRIASGKVQLEPVPLEMRASIERALQSLRSQAAAKDLQLEVTGSDQAVFVDADSVRFEQIVTNLVENAIKFSNPGGRISIELETRNAQASISVTDHGIGIAPEMLDRIFDPFVQANSDGAGRPGLGLGLAIVKRLVEQQGGTVEVHSEGIGRGARFTFCLPLSTGTRQPPLPARLAKGAHQLVLIADDDADSLHSMKELLEMQGHVVLTANDGPSALAEIRRQRPAVAILDLDMPGLNGRDVALKVRQESWGNSIVLIALTGHGFPGDHAKSLQSGFDAHLEKPADLDELARLIRAEPNGNSW